MRALNNIRWLGVGSDEENGGGYDLSGHGPDVNQPRDPRNGRNGELLTECPFLGGEVAEGYVRGMQWGKAATWNDTTVARMAASLKHYTAYSLETHRMSSTGNVSMFDLWDTYLPQFEAPFVRADAAGTMCSYFSAQILNPAQPPPPGPAVYVPSCANPYLLNTVVREYWNRPDATHLSDCGAVWNMAYENYFVSNLTQAAAVSLNAGMDMNSNTINPSEMALAISLNLTSSGAVYAAAGRILAQRLRTGQFDPLETTPGELLAFGADDIGSAANAASAAEAMAQGLVLLRNNASVLPLKAGTGRIAVLGPTGNLSSAQIGDMYANTNGLCPSGGLDCMPMLADAISAINGAKDTVTFPGVTMLGNDSSWGAAIAAVSQASTVLLCLGTDRSVAGEGNDRSDIGLPGLQSAFALAVLAAAAPAKIPVVLVLVHNLPVSFDELVQPPNSTYAPVSAIVDAWAPTMHANVVAQALFGIVNRWGKSVLTVYPHDYQDAISLFSFDMSLPPGRSYKYYSAPPALGPPLIAFGEGQSYSTFTISCSGGLSPDRSVVALSCNISNTAGPDGDEVLMAFHRPSAGVVALVDGRHPLPLSTLVGFQRVSVPAGTTRTAAIVLPVYASLTFVNEVGASVLYPGTHFVDVRNGNGFNQTIAIELATSTVVRAPPLPQ